MTAWIAAASPRSIRPSNTRGRNRDTGADASTTDTLSPASASSSVEGACSKQTSSARPRELAWASRCRNSSVAGCESESDMTQSLADRSSGLLVPAAAALRGRNDIAGSSRFAVLRRPALRRDVWRGLDPPGRARSPRHVFRPARRASVVPRCSLAYSANVGSPPKRWAINRNACRARPRTSLASPPWLPRIRRLSSQSLRSVEHCAPVPKTGHRCLAPPVPRLPKAQSGRSVRSCLVTAHDGRVRHGDRCTAR